MKRILLSCVCISLLIWIPSSRASDEDRFTDTLRLIKTTGTLDIGSKVATNVSMQFISYIKTQHPDAPPAAFEIIEEETAKWIGEEMAPDSDYVRELVQLYNEYFTSGEIAQLLEFYESDVGRKIISTLPELSDKAMLLGQTWGQSKVPVLQERILQRFKEQGIALD